MDIFVFLIVSNSNYFRLLKIKVTTKLAGEGEGGGLRPEWSDHFYILALLREDTHKKSVFSGRTTKGVRRVNPPDHQPKNTFFFSSKILLF